MVTEKNKQKIMKIMMRGKYVNPSFIEGIAQMGFRTATNFLVQEYKKGNMERIQTISGTYYYKLRKFKVKK